MKDLKLSGIIGLLTQFVRRFHTIIFFLLVSTSLFVAILTLIDIIGASSGTAATSNQTINGTFDNTTIQRINDATTKTVQPGSRPSPFVE